PFALVRQKDRAKAHAALIGHCRKRFSLNLVCAAANADGLHALLLDPFVALAQTGGIAVLILVNSETVAPNRSAKSDAISKLLPSLKLEFRSQRSEPFPPHRFPDCDSE